MNKYLFLLLLIFPASILAQDKKWMISAGPHLDVPTYYMMTSAGYGGSVNIERVYNRKIAGVLTVAYDEFSTRVYHPWEQEIKKGFSLLPVLIGVKYYISPVFYASGQAGATIGLKNTGRFYAIAPGAGAMLPIKKQPKLDLGLRFLLTSRMPSFDENSFLDRGGYSFLTARIGYYF